MPCPCFLPDEPIEGPLWRGLLRPPLGRLYQGGCAASGGRFRPAAADLELCNLGYAAEGCGRFPNGQPDALNFTALRDDGAVVVLRYAFERRCRPAGSGSLRYRRGDQALEGAPAGTPLAAQGLAYVRSYLLTQGRRSLGEPD